MVLKTLTILAAASTVLAKVQFVGVNIAGFEFGCLIDGTCPSGGIQPPLTSLGGGDGAGQMQHFVKDDQMNIFRIPVSWQYLVNNQLGGTLDATNFGKYDQVMQACLATGAYCKIDIHNFARFNGGIIGQGGPTDDQFASLWTQLATKYKSNSNVIFGLMNEPHDLDVPTWAKSVQNVVTAIRNVGATSQMILLPGTNFASSFQFVSSGSAAALLGVKNPDGSTTGLIYDLHKYFDTDNSGSHSECVTDNTAAFQTSADFLRQNGRQALISETGAGNTPNCFTDFCAQSTFLNANSDVFLGYIAWAAGSFATSYILSLTPSKQNGKYTDQSLLSQCVLSPWYSAPSVVATPTPSTTLVTSTSAAVSTTGTDVSSAAATTSAVSSASSGAVDGTSTSGGSTIVPASSTGSVGGAGGAAGGANTNPTTSTGSTATTSLAKSTSSSGAKALKYESGVFFGGLILAALL